MNKLTGLFEREPEIERISSVLQKALQGDGSILFIAGAPGVGKTELLRQAHETAAAEGFRLLRAKGSEMERDFAHGVVRQLFEPVLASASPEQRAAWFSGAASLARKLLEPTEDSESNGVSKTSIADPGFPLVHGLYWLCDNIAREGPLFIGVDDLQWADEPSVRFLMYLARRLEGLPVTLALTARATEESSNLRTQLERHPEFEACLLEPLGPEGTAAMLRSGFGYADDSFLKACYESTGGNPFLMTELISALRYASVDPANATPSVLSKLGPPGVAKSILLRVESSSADAARLARAVALLGDGADLRRAAKLCGLDLEQAGPAADILVAADILRDTRPLEFVHPLVRSAIYAELSTSERSFGHGRAARLLAEDGEPAEKVAAHLLEAEPVGDRWVVRTLRLAAAKSLTRGAAGPAIAFLRRALREPPAPADRPQVLHELGKVEQRAEPGTAIEHLSEAFDLQSDAEARAKTGLELIRALFHADRVREAVEVVQRSLNGLRGENPALAMQLDAELISLLRIGIATSPLAYERLEQWKGKVEGRSPPERVLLVHLAVVDALSGTDASAVADMAERALGGGMLLAEQSAESLVTYLPLYPLLCADHFETVETFLKECFIQAREVGSAFAFTLASGWRSWLQSAKGDVKDAEADALNALQLVVESPNPSVFLQAGLDALITPLVEQGEFDRAEAALQQHGMQGQLPDSVPSRFLLASRGYLRLAEGRPERAMDDFMELMRREERTGPANLFLTPYRSLAALAASRMGEADKARGLAGEALANARAWGARRELGNALRFAGLVQPGQSGLEFLYEAVGVLELSAARLVYAAALTDLGAELARLGRRREAMEKLRAGLDLAHRCSATRLEKRAHKELIDLGARPRRPAIFGEESLTASERRVCEMAAEGLSNRDIAETLFVTLRTVELHLTHAYQKLGIRSREELRKVLRGLGSSV